MMEKRGSCMGAMGTAHNRSAPWEATHNRRRSRICTAYISTWGGSVMYCAIISPRDPPLSVRSREYPSCHDLSLGRGSQRRPLRALPRPAAVREFRRSPPPAASPLLPNLRNRRRQPTQHRLAAEAASPSRRAGMERIRSLSAVQLCLHPLRDGDDVLEAGDRPVVICEPGANVRLQAPDPPATIKVRVDGDVCVSGRPSP